MLYKFLFFLFNSILLFFIERANHSRIVALSKSRKYINFCIKGVLINNYKALKYTLIIINKCVYII